MTDQETFSCPPDKDDPTKACADPEASWGHRRGDGHGQKDELFYGYYFSATTVVKDAPGPAVPELIRRTTLSSCSVKPFTTIVPVLERLARCGVALGDILADSGYAHRVARNWAQPLRTLGAAIVVDLHPSDLHPSDRGPQGTWAGAILANGNLYCTATPAALLGLAPLRRGASSDETAAHDKLTAEAAHYKLAPISSDDADGYHRAACPALTGKTPLAPAARIHGAWLRPA